MLATAVAIGTCEQFKIHKVDGTTGDLHDGDPVNLTLGSWYASAEQGGNDFVNINRTAAQSWETFTIVKLYTYSTPGTRIMSGDRVAFMTSDHIHYVEAANNGGGGVDTYATSPGSTSTFILHD